MEDKSYITIVGGANIDIIGLPHKKLRMKDSNPGKTTMTLGGVGRNIGENLARLGIDTRLITVLGNDIYGKLMIEEGMKIGLDMSESLILPEMKTSTYIAILDELGDMELALSSMDIFEKMTISFIQYKREIIENSALCIVDTNIPKEVLRYMLINFKVDFFLDTVSTSKAEKIKNMLGKFHTIKANRLESETLSGVEIVDKIDLKKVATYFIDTGVERVFITLGEDGVYYLDKQKELHMKSPKISIVNATGAGDAFMAGLAYSYFNGLDIERTIKFAQGASFITLEVGFKTEEFPAFFTRKSGFKLDYRIEDEEKLAKTIKTKWDLGLDGGVVVANPIPKEYEMDPKVIDKAIKDALNEAENKGIKGKDLTPFLLDKVKKITGGRSLQSNLELVYNNAVVGANLAVMLEKLYIG